MTTTACDDQFVSNTEKHIAMFSIEDILRRNVAELEVALKQQTDRAEAAEAELLAVREDNHSMMLEINSLRAPAPSVPDCLSCANRGRVNGLSQESFCESCVYEGRGWRKDHYLPNSVSTMTLNVADSAKRRCEACAILPCSCK